jgi:endonuclease YncB( thermonuclease family)
VRRGKSGRGPKRSFRSPRRRPVVNHRRAWQRSRGKPHQGSIWTFAAIALLVGAYSVTFAINPSQAVVEEVPQKAFRAPEAASPRAPSAALPSSTRSHEGANFRCTVAQVTDGDTFRCRETDDAQRQIRVRLSGVAARERDGSCSEGHPCPAASAEAATAQLAELASGRILTCRSTGSTYGRISAFCRRPDGTDLSCAMVESGTVVVWDRYWQGHSCP